MVEKKKERSIFTMTIIRTKYPMQKIYVSGSTKNEMLCIVAIVHLHLLLVK